MIMRNLVLALAALAACTPSKLAYGQVKSAMIDAGLSDSTAACMANRMTDRLSLISSTSSSGSKARTARWVNS